MAITDSNPYQVDAKILCVWNVEWTHGGSERFDVYDIYKVLKVRQILFYNNT